VEGAARRLIFAGLKPCASTEVVCAGAETPAREEEALSLASVPVR
jgi:hypothetical protein